MAKLLCICGKIGCGKTYYANRLKEQEHAVILSTDEQIINKVTAMMNLL